MLILIYSHHFIILLILQTSAWVALYSKMVPPFDFVPHRLVHIIY